MESHGKIARVNQTERVFVFVCGLSSSCLLDFISWGVCLLSGRLTPRMRASTLLRAEAFACVLIASRAAPLLGGIVGMRA